MLTWLSFCNLSFWLVLTSFIVLNNNFFNLIVLSEIIWIVLYCLSGIVGSVIDEINCFGLTFLILGLASIELSIGLLFLVALRRLKISISLDKNSKSISKTFSKFLYINKNNKKII